MFKPGDKVKYKDGGHFSNHERVVTVEKVVGSQVWFKETRTHTSSTTLELVKDGPVRTVTRTEIVPGVYGRVEVLRREGDVTVVGFIKNSIVKADSWTGLSAKELREAAHLFNQLAEVLDNATQG